MKKPSKSYSEVVEHGGHTYNIIINTYDEPCARTAAADMHTYIRVETEGRKFLERFLEDPIEDSELPQAIKDITKHIEKHKNESSKEHFSQN